MRRYLLFSICVMVLAIASSHCAAGIIPLTVDSNNSVVAISIDGGPFQSSPVTGTASIDLSAHSPFSGTAQLTTLDLTVTNGLSFPVTVPLFGGSATASTVGGDVSLSLVAPGTAGTLFPVPPFSPLGGSFAQLANQTALDGDLTFGNLEGSAIFDFDTLAISPIDFDAPTVAQSGNTFTTADSFVFAQEFDAAGTLFSLDVVVRFSASGTKVVPEPGSTMILIGMGTVWLTRRRR